MRAITQIKNLIKYPFLKAVNNSGSRFCPVCKNNIKNFKSFGVPRRLNAQCPLCGSLERHRLDWIFFSEKTNLFDGLHKKMLHIAPEEFLSSRLRQIRNLNYLSADLKSPRAMVKMDITDIQYPDNTFDVIYCSHVLEHIPDDRKALSELYRVLSPGGWAVLQVPITGEKTEEDLSIVDPRERLKRYGHHEHVRMCGPDYVERMKDAGFEAQVLRSIDVVAESGCERMGFKPDRIIFFCAKR